MQQLLKKHNTSNLFLRTNVCNLMRKSTRIKYSFLFLLLAFTACKKEKTNWDSDYKLILVNDTLRLQNISKDSLFAAGGSGELRLSFEKDLFNFDVSEMVAIPDTTIVQKYGLTVNSYVVQPGFSFVNQVKSHVFDMQGAKMTFIGIKEGFATLEVQNPFETNATFELSLPKVKKNNVALQKTIVVGKGTVSNPTKAQITVDLSGYDIDLTDASGTAFNSLQTSMKVTSDPNGSSVEITKYDTTVFQASFTNLKIDRAKGYFGMLTSNSSFDKDIEFFNKLSGYVAIEDYNMSLILENSCKLEGLLKILNLSNFNTKTNTSVNLQHQIIGNPIFVESATGNWQSHQPYTRVFDFVTNNSNLSTFLGNLGSKIQGNLELKLNPNGDTYSGWNELYADSRLKLKLKADMPLKVTMIDLKFKDTFAINLKNQADKTHFKNGSFILDVTNAYPVEFTPTLTFINESGQSIGQVQVSSTIHSATGGSITYNGLICEKTKVEFVITEDLAAHLETANRVIVEFKASTIAGSSNPQEAVYLPYNAFIATKLYGDFKINFRLGK